MRLLDINGFAAIFGFVVFYKQGIVAFIKVTRNVIGDIEQFNTAFIARAFENSQSSWSPLISMYKNQYIMLNVKC